MGIPCNLPDHCDGCHVAEEIESVHGDIVLPEECAVCISIHVDEVENELYDFKIKVDERIDDLDSKEPRDNVCLKLDYRPLFNDYEGVLETMEERIQNLVDFPVLDFDQRFREMFETARLIGWFIRSAKGRLK